MDMIYDFGYFKIFDVEDLELFFFIGQKQD